MSYFVPDVTLGDGVLRAGLLGESSLAPATLGSLAIAAAR